MQIQTVLLALATAACAASSAAKYKTANVTEDDNVPGLSHSLSWTGLTEEFGAVLSSAPNGQGAENGSYYARVNGFEGTGAWTSVYKGSKVSFFDFKRLAVGCEVDHYTFFGGVAYINFPNSADCTVTINGYKTASSSSPSVSYKYNFTAIPSQQGPGGGAYYNMTEVYLPSSFVGLQKATISAAPPPGSNLSDPKANWTSLHLGIDIVNYKTYNLTY